MRFGSVCSGIEAATVAWQPLGWEAAWLAEIDVSASQVLAHRLGATAPRFPLPGAEKAISRLQWGERVVNWGDMIRLPEAVRSGAAEAPDILCGGTPCQAFSVAGRREGLADHRGQLTLSFVDLADAIDTERAEQGDEPCVASGRTSPEFSATGLMPSAASLLRLRGKMCRSSRQGSGGRTLVLCLDPKEQLRGDSRTPNISAWPNDAAVSSLSQVLVRGLIPERYFLSSTACAGILRRAEKRGKQLPPLLDRALRATVAGAAPAVQVVGMTEDGSVLLRVVAPVNLDWLLAA